MKKLLVLTVMVICSFGAFAQKDAKYYYKHAMEQSDLNKVIADFTKAIELQPGFKEAYFYRGIAYLNNKGVTKAIADFDKVIALDPVNAEVWYYKAQANEKQSNPAEALKSYNKAIQLNPKLSDAYYKRGLLLNKQGKQGCPDIKKAKKLGTKVSAEDLAACGGDAKDKK